jgi:hypothetical protein
MFSPSDRKVLDELRADYLDVSNKLREVLDKISRIETKLETYEWQSINPKDNIPSRATIYKLTNKNGIPRIELES